MQNQYLPAEALSLLGTLLKTRPLGGVGAGLFLLGMIYGGLKWKFKRGGIDLFLFAMTGTALMAFIAACLWILARSPGYRIL